MEDIFYWECPDCTGYNKPCATCEGAGFLDAEGPVDPSAMADDTGYNPVEVDYETGEVLD